MVELSFSYGPVGPKAITTPDDPVIMGEANANAI